MSLRRTVLFVAAGAVAMAVLLPCLALVRDTTAHDWYAARELTVAQVIHGVGFDPYKAMVYRTADGASMRIHRFAFVVYGEPIRARAHILTTAGDHAVLGAIAGAIGAALCVVVFVGARRSRRHRPGVPATAGVPGLAAHPETWTGFGDIADVSRGGGSKIGLLVVSPAQIEGRVEVYGPVEIRGPLPVGRIVQDAAGLDENTAWAVQRADAHVLQTTPALPAAKPPGTVALRGAADPEAAAASESAKANAAAAPGSTAKDESRVGRTPRGQSPTPGKDPIIEADGAAVREDRVPARPKPGNGGGGDWL